MTLVRARGSCRVHLCIAAEIDTELHRAAITSHGGLSEVTQVAWMQQREWRRRRRGRSSNGSRGESGASVPNDGLSTVRS